MCWRPHSRPVLQLLAGFSILAGSGSVAAAPPPLELSVKAAFLTKFSRYVEWPPSARPAGAPFELCIVGSDPFGTLIDQAARSDPGPLVVRRVLRAEHARTCAMALLVGTREQSPQQMAAVLQNLPVLTITDGRFGSGQGMIHFAVRQGKVGFHIDDAMAGRSRLGISSRLLNLALSVRQRRG